MNTSLQHFDFSADRDLEAIAERELWTSVFLQAINDLTGTTRLYHTAAQRWFECTSKEPCAFLWVCIHLNLDPAAVLERILHDGEVGKSLASNDTLPLHARRYRRTGSLNRQVLHV
jgi:hypothetical protein